MYLHRSIKRLGYIPASRSELAARDLDTNSGLVLERMNQKMLQIEKKLTGGSSLSPSKLESSPLRRTSDTSTDKLNRLIFRTEECERQIERLKYSTSDHALIAPASTVDLKASIKTLGKNTSRAVKQVSAGLEDVQHATVRLFEWAEKVHNAFETVSYKLDYPTNICPRVQVNMRRSRISEASAVAPAATDFIFTDI